MLLGRTTLRFVILRLNLPGLLFSHRRAADFIFTAFDTSPAIHCEAGQKLAEG